MTGLFVFVIKYLQGLFTQMKTKPLIINGTLDDTWEIMVTFGIDIDEVLHMVQLSYQDI